MTCPRCVQGVVRGGNGGGPPGVFCDCPAGLAAAAKPCTCPTLADLVPGFRAMLDDLASILPPLTAEEETVYSRAAAWREAQAHARPVCRQCGGNVTVPRAGSS